MTAARCRFPQNAAVSDPALRQDPQIRLREVTAVSSPASETHSAELLAAHNTAEQTKEQSSQVKLPREFMKQSYCTRISFVYPCKTFYGILIDSKMNCALLYTNFTKILESYTRIVTESFVVSLLMINCPAVVWKRRIFPALTQDVSLLVHSKAAIDFGPRITALSKPQCG